MSEILDQYGQPVMLKIDEVIIESDDTKTFIFRHNLNYKAGQFIMVWLPGVDEKPFAVSNFDKDFFGFTVLARGKFTKLLHEMKKGDGLGVRGPFGKGFSIQDGVLNANENACLIGGGCGTSSLVTLIEKYPKNNTVAINGATTKSKLLFTNRFEDMIIYTDDGSAGEKGYPIDALEDLHKEHGFDIIYTCGPEIMMFKVYEFCKANNIKCEASLERYMKCGIGICGQCVCDGRMVCKDGPVFNLKELNDMDDFGKYSLLKSGQKVSIKDYGEWRGE